MIDFTPIRRIKFKLHYVYRRFSDQNLITFTLLRVASFDRSKENAKNAVTIQKGSFREGAPDEVG